MRDEQGFDLWADGYDESVREIEQAKEYPFAGYCTVLNTIYKKICQKEKAAVLDVGFGTGRLTKKLYDNGCTVCGIDFSEKMIALAKAKMPKAQLVQWDFSKGLPPQFEGQSFDFIVSTYAIHHLTDAQKRTFLPQLVAHLRPSGAVLLGDVMFPNRAARDACRERSAAWDSAEYYIVVEDLADALGNYTFQKISFCSGVVVLQKQTTK